MITKEDIKNQMELLLKLNENAPDGSFEKMVNRKYIDCDLESKSMEFSCTILKSMINHIGVCHGGVLAGLMDECMGYTVHAFLSDRSGSITTSDMQFNCLKPLLENDSIIIKCCVKHIGSRTAIVSSEIYKDNVLCAFSTENFARIDNKFNSKDLKK